MHPEASQLKHQASLLAQQGRYADAAALYTRYLSQHPQDAHAGAQLGLTLINAGQHRAGRKAAEQAVATNPQEPMAHYALAMGVLSDPMHTSPQAVPWAPNTWSTAKNRANQNAVNNPPGQTLKSPRLREAEKHLLEAIRLEPEAAFLHAQLAFVRLIDEGTPGPGVQAAIDTGLALDPEDALCHEYQVRLRLAQNDPSAAYTDAQRLLSLAPNHATAHALVARCLLQQPIANIEQATNHARTAAQLDPSDDEARDVLMECFHQRHAVYRFPLRLAQRVHRFRAQRSPWILLGIGGLSLVIAGLILVAIAALTNTPGLLRYGLGALAVIAVLLWSGATLPRYLATVLMMRDPETRPGISKQSGMEAALLIAGVVYALSAAIVWWWAAPNPDGKLVLLSAACFATAIAAWCCAAPGNDRQQMLLATVALALTWAGCSAAVLFLNWPLAPVLYLLPFCFGIGMTAWVANREDTFNT